MSVFLLSYKLIFLRYVLITFLKSIYRYNYDTLRLGYMKWGDELYLSQDSCYWIFRKNLVLWRGRNLCCIKAKLKSVFTPSKLSINKESRDWRAKCYRSKQFFSKMSNTTCSNITNLGMANCTNGSATGPMPPFTFDLYSSTSKIIAYTTVYSIVSVVAFIGKINQPLE